MFCYVICFVIIILKTVAAELKYENPEILLNCSNRIHEKYTIDKTKPLKLILKNCNAKYLQCNNHFADRKSDFQIPVSFPVNINNTINITNLSYGMSTWWDCAALEEYYGGRPYRYKNHDYTSIRLWFTIHIKGAKSVNISVNSMNLILKTTDLSVKDYDGESRYFYEDGEIIDYVCSSSSKSNTLQLQYYDGKDTLMFKTNEEEAAPKQFRSVLRAQNNYAYVICTLTSTKHREKYHYKTTFILKNPDSVKGPDDRAIDISINGLKLVPLPSSTTTDNNSDFYQYKYIEGDILNITCEKHKQIKGNFELILPENLRWSSQGKLKSKHETISVSLDSSNMKINNTNLTCGINTSDEQKIFAKIRFISDLPKKGVRIRGLRLESVKYQYNDRENQWIIGYQYRANETLNLTCVYKYRNKILQWRRESKQAVETIKTYQHYNKHVLTQNSNRSFILLEEHNQSSIACECLYKKEVSSMAKVILYLKPESEASTDTERIDNELLFIILGASFGVVIAVITAVCFARWSKMKQRGKFQNAYENFLYQNENPIPQHPSQWENYYHNPHYSQNDENAILDSPAHLGDTKNVPATRNTGQSKTPSENYYTEMYEHIHHKSLESGRNTSNPYDKDCGQEYTNIIYDSTENIASYNVLRRSNIISCNHEEKYENSGYLKISEKSSKPKSVTFKHDSNIVRPACSPNHIANTSISNDILKNSVNPFAEVDKGDVYAQPYELTQKGSRDANSFVPNDKNMNSSDCAENYFEITEEFCENYSYGT